MIGVTPGSHADVPDRPRRWSGGGATLCAMKVYVFQSGKEPDLVGFTVDATGANLPADLAPWTAWTPSEAEAAIETEPDAAAATDIGPSAPALAAIERDGFHVLRAETIGRMTGIPWVR